MKWRTSMNGTTNTWTKNIYFKPWSLGALGQWSGSHGTWQWRRTPCGPHRAHQPNDPDPHHSAWSFLCTLAPTRLHHPCYQTLLKTCRMKNCHIPWSLSLSLSLCLQFVWRKQNSIRLEYIVEGTREFKMDSNYLDGQYWKIWCLAKRVVEILRVKLQSKACGHDPIISLFHTLYCNFLSLEKLL